MAGIDITHNEESSTQTRKESGYASRKFWLTVYAMNLIAILGVLSGLAMFGGLAAVLSVIVGGILGGLAIYAGANVSTKFAAAQVSKAQVAADGKVKLAEVKPPVKKMPTKPPLEQS